MLDFRCSNCGQRLTFENFVCLSYGSALGFSLKDMALLVIGDAEHVGAIVAGDYQPCAKSSSGPMQLVGPR